MLISGQERPDGVFGRHRTSRDIDSDGIPDECEPDCNNNGLPDDLDIAQHTSDDVNGNGVPDECDPDCNGNRVPDDLDITQGTSNDVNGNAIPDECESDCNENGIPDDWDIAQGTSPDCNGNGIPDQCETIIYVDQGAAEGLQSGSNWEGAYLELSEALVAVECLTFPLEIRVAQGLYKPDPTGLSEPRQATFQLAAGVRILGGYAGLGEPDPEQRSVELYETVLSGDLLGNDGPAPFQNYSDNCWTVVTAMHGAGPTAVLDGFTITGGEGNTGGYEYMHGGGLYIAQDGAPNVINCTFMANRAEWGGGVACYDSSSPTFRNCTFTGNKTPQEGGGMWIGRNVHSTLTDCTFSDNSADNTGGGLFSHGDATLAQCSFFRNTARFGGGVYVEGPTRRTLVNCTFVGNTADEGGGLYNHDADTALVNCTFSGNSALNAGGAIYHYADYDSGGTPMLANCIVWGNGDEVQIGPDNSHEEVIITHTCIRGCWLGESNLCTAPQFVRYPDPGPDETWGTADDDLGDLHLTRSSPCIDAGDNLAVGVMGVTTDFEGDIRYVDGNGDDAQVVDMGADEYFVDCNANGTHDGTDILNGTSYDWNENGIPDECDDCNGNGFADVIDIVFGDSEDCSANWIPDECDIASGTSEDQGGDGVPDECLDCNYNGIPDFVDILVGRSQDCNNNDRPDECDIADETALDWNHNGIPDECEEDCNENGLPDFLDIIYGLSQDRNFNGVPDECDLPGDLNGDGSCDLVDHELFAACMFGPGTFPPPGCPVAPDLDQDLDVDFADFALFQADYGKPIP